MTLAHYVQLYLLIAVIVIIAYYVSLWDVNRMRRHAEKQAEHKRLLELLKRK